MELNVRQQRILRGEICPYCGRETELVNADKIYSRKGLGMVMMCKPCNAYVGVHESGPNKGKAKGRLAGPSLRSLKIRVHAELDRLWSTPEERERMFDILPRLKAMGFLDTNVWNPGISTAGITHTLQFGNALPKNVFRC